MFLMMLCWQFTVSTDRSIILFNVVFFLCYVGRLTLLVVSFTIFISFLIIPISTHGETNDYFFCGGLLGMFSSVSGLLHIHSVTEEETRIM